MSLLSRVIRLESRVKTPAYPVHVVFRHVGEPDEKVISHIVDENYFSESLVIMVEFVTPTGRYQKVKETRYV